MRKRVRDHLSGNGSKRLRAAIKKHGQSRFAVTILESCSRSDLAIAEAAWVERLRPAYNIAKPNGEGGHIVSPLTRGKIAAKKTGLRHTEETKAKLRADWAERDHSERRARMRKAALGRKVSPITRAKKSAALKGKPWSTARRLAEQRRTDLGFIDKEYRL
jgi:group I intron endonuclease